MTQQRIRATHSRRWNDPQHPRHKRVTHSLEYWPDDKEMFLIVCEEQHRQGNITKDQLEARVDWTKDPARWPLIFDSIIMGRKDWFDVGTLLDVVDIAVKQLDSPDLMCMSDNARRRWATAFFTDNLLGQHEVALARRLVNL